MDVEKFLEEVKSSYAEYYRPVSHVIPMRFEEDEYSPIRYIVSSNDDCDYGGFVVKTDSFSDFWFDWYSGKWATADKDVKLMLERQDVQEALSVKYGDISVCPDLAENHIDAWKKIISRCLRNDDSLVDELDVMDLDSNGMECVPAASFCKADEWLKVSMFDTYLKNAIKNRW